MSQAHLITSIIIGSCIAILTLVSLSPQSFSFIRNRTSRGISFFTLWIGFTTACFVLIGALILNYNWTIKEVSHLFNGDTSRILNLINQIVVIWQLLMLALMYFVNLTLYLIFARRDLRQRFTMLETSDVPAPVDDVEADLLTQDEIQDMGVTSTRDNLDLAIGYTFYRSTSNKEWQTFRSKRRLHYLHVSLYIMTLLLLLLITVGSSLYLVTRKQDFFINSLAQALGYFSSVVIFVQWIPQIVHTFVSKSPGNFSIVMMLMLCPGAFVNVLYLASTGQSISTWMSYFISGIQQCVLLTLLIYYSVKERLAKRKEKQQNATFGKMSSPMSISEENLRLAGADDKFGYGAM